MYNYSTLEKVKDANFHVRLFNMLDFDDVHELEKILREGGTEESCTIVKKNEYFCEKLGTVLVYVEWYNLIVEKVSPFEKDDSYGG